MTAVLLALPAGGCGNKKSTQETDVTKTAAKLTEKDLEGVITGLDDHFILENAKNIDYLHGIKYDDEIIKDVKVDNKEVKLSKSGKYTATYTVSVDVDALKEYQEEKADEEKDSSKDKGQAEEKDTAKKDPSSSSKDGNEEQEKDAENTAEDKKESGKDTGDSIADANKEEAADKDTSGDKEKDPSDGKEETAADKVSSNDKEDAADEANSGSKEDTADNTANDTEQAGDEEKDDTDTSKDEPVKDDSAAKNEEPEKGSNIEDVAIDKEIEVVDKETAEDLADKGEVVWTDDNDTVPKTDGTKVEEVVKEPESTSESGKPAASAGKDNDKQTSASKPDNAVNQTNAGNTGNSGNASNGNADKPAGCSHNWAAQYKTVNIPEQGHYEPVYETVTDYETRPVYRPAMVCHCGAVFFDENAYADHSAFECSIGGWSVQEVQVGTEQVAVGSHQVQTGQKWVVDSPATTKQQLTGYRCNKCGATK